MKKSAENDGITEYLNKHGLEGAVDLIMHAESFLFGKVPTYPFHHVWVVSRGGTWVVWNGAACFTRDHYWEIEPFEQPLPSWQTDHFIRRTRYTFEEAVTIARGLVAGEIKEEVI